MAQGFGINLRFQLKDNWFSQAGNTFWTEILYIKKNFGPVDGQTRWAKSSSQLVNLSGAWVALTETTDGSFTS